MKRLSTGQFAKLRCGDGELRRTMGELALYLEGSELVGRDTLSPPALRLKDLARFDRASLLLGMSLRVADITDLGVAKQVATLALAENERAVLAAGGTSARSTAAAAAPARSSHLAQSFCPAVGATRSISRSRLR